MSVEKSIEEIANYALTHRKWLSTEEAVKTSVVLRLFSALGYDIHDPREVVPEFTADVGTKRGEKVDYAILFEDRVQIIVECKSPDTDLRKVGLSQLFRYYATTEARFAILTNSYVWKFFADTEVSNKMDLKPFLTVDLTELTPDMVAGLTRFTKTRFCPDSVARAAVNARTDRAIMREITSELSSPSEELIRLITRRVYDGRITERVFEDFESRVKNMMRETLQEIARVRAELIMKSHRDASQRPDAASSASPEQGDIVTTQDEIDGFNITVGLARQVIDPSRIVIRDQKTYCNVLVDNNNRKPLLRMWFNNPDRLQIEFFDGQSPSKALIDRPGDIRKFADRVHATAALYRSAAA